MDAKELKELGRVLLETLDAEGQPLCSIRHQIGRIVSHLESEQDSRIAIHRELIEVQKFVNQHDKALFGDRNDLEKHPGIVLQLSEIMKGHKRNAKLLWTVIATVAGFAAIELLKFLF